MMIAYQNWNIEWLNLHPWRYTKPSEHVHEQSALADLALSNGVGLNNLQRSFPTSTILCFCGKNLQKAKRSNWVGDRDMDLHKF